MPLFVGATLMYALVMLIMIGLGLNAAVAGVLAVAVCFLTVWGILRAIVERKRRLFRRQLLQALTLMASQIEAGSGPKRALEQIVAQLEDPLGEELGAALAQTVASKDLVGALRDLSVRYPSRAFSMFIAAMEIDEMQGGSLAPALRQAAALLSRDFELVEEAQAELSQTRSEFFIVTGIIGFICVFMFEAGGQAAHDAYTSFIGIVILSIFIANFAFGIFRVLKLLSKAKGKS